MRIAALIGSRATINCLYSFFYLYRISYMYGVILGFVLTFTVGYLASHAFYALKLQSMDQIYVKGSINEIDSDLFTPPLAKRIKRDWQKKQDSCRSTGREQ